MKTARIQTGELNRIRNKSKDIEQDALPLEVDPAGLGG